MLRSVSLAHRWHGRAVVRHSNIGLAMSLLGQMGCRDRYISNTGLECGQPWRLFRAKSSLEQTQQTVRLFDHLVG